MARSKDPGAWQIEDAERLSALFTQHKGPFSIAEFARRHEIGPQISQYLAGQLPLSVNIAAAFARGLGVEIDVISPRLATESRRLPSELDTIITLTSVSNTLSFH